MPAIVGGLSKLISQLDAVGLEFETNDLVAGAEVILNYALDLVPYDTGFLYNSGQLKIEDNDVLIVFDAEYASYVEFGTSRMEAQPFLRPALDEAQDEALSAIVSSVESHMRDITK